MNFHEIWEIVRLWTTDELDVVGWASSWTSPLSARPPGGIPASEAAQGE